VEKDEEFVRTLASLGAAVEGLIKQNNAIDIYEEYFAGIATDHSAEPPSAATVTVFRDPHSCPGARRATSCVAWHPDGCSKAVVSYSVIGFQRQPPGMPLSSCVFDVASPNAPETELLGVSQLVVARYNLKDPNLIGAGQYNGQFAVFDTRKGPAPVDATPVDVSHRWAFGGTRARSC
jgi:dynein intermediate chain 2